MQGLYSIFVNHLTTESRLNAADPPTSIAITAQPPQHPIHFLQSNDVLEAQFSSYFRKAFSKDLIVHRNAGNTVPLLENGLVQFNALKPFKTIQTAAKVVKEKKAEVDPLNQPQYEDYFENSTVVRIWRDSNPRPLRPKRSALIH